MGVQSTNRTNLELKRGIIQVQENMKVGYQSHQSGIETRNPKPKRRKHPQLPIAPIWNWNLGFLFYYLFGYILPIAPIWNWNLVNEDDWMLRMATNRTNLELKLIQSFSFSWFFFLPIAPIWNWNGDAVDQRPRSFFLPIAPICNWNDVWTGSGATDHRLPIAPIWNWNDSRDYSGRQSPMLPIAPIWNWNSMFIKGNVTVNTTNRTNLELKLWFSRFIF